MSDQTPQEPSSDKVIIGMSRKSLPTSYEWLSLLMSAIAIIVSSISIYFQFFYEKSEIWMDSLFATYSDSTVIGYVSFHNRGNQNETIIKCYIAPSLEDEKKYFSFQKYLKDDTSALDLIDLKPGDRILKKIKLNIRLNDVYDDNSVDRSKPYIIGYHVNFINRGHKAYQFVPLIELQSDSNGKIIRQKFEFISAELLPKKYSLSMIEHYGNE